MRKMERFLISVLWINVVLIIAMWFFNWFFGFSIVARSHWRYLSELQVSGTVEPKFYIAISIFGFLSLVGLYFLIFPWYRKIRVSGVSNSQVLPMVPVPISSTVKNNLPENPPEKLEFTRFQKPPKLNLNNIFIPTMAEKREINNSVGLTEMQEANEELKSKIKNLMEWSGLVVKEVNQIDGIKLDLCAIGAGDTLLLGILCNENGAMGVQGDDSVWHVGTRSFKSPTSKVIEIKNKIKALFAEVLDESMQINILPFVFVDGSIVNMDDMKDTWGKMGVSVFVDTISFGDTISKYKLDIADDEEKSEIDAFSEFIDTVIEHFKNV